MDEGEPERLHQGRRALGVQAVEGFSIDEAGGSGFKKQPTEKQTRDRLLQTAVLGISDEALLADQQVMDVRDSILALQDLQAVKNILEHEDVQDIRKSARATCTPDGHRRTRCEKGYTSTVEDRRADSGGPEQGMGNVAIPRRHSVGTSPRHASTCPNAKASWPQT